jgi:hypothetical protein
LQFERLCPVCIYFLSLNSGSFLESLYSMSVLKCVYQFSRLNDIHILPHLLTSGYYSSIALHFDQFYSNCSLVWGELCIFSDSKDSTWVQNCMPAGEGSQLMDTVDNGFTSNS